MKKIQDLKEFGKNGWEWTVLSDKSVKVYRTDRYGNCLMYKGEMIEGESFQVPGERLKAKEYIENYFNY